jgi:surface protein
MKKDKAKEKKLPTKFIFPLLILFTSFVMCIGYAAVNSIIIGFEGEAVAKEVDGVFITDVSYVSNTDADLNTSKVVSAYQTNLTSVIALSKTNNYSAISYEITVYNSTNSDYSYVKPSYVLGDSTYDNQNITFSVTGISEGEIIKSKGYKIFYVNFYYTNNVLAYNNVLNSIINFEFEPYVEEIVSAGTLINIGNNTANVFGSTLSKTSVEKIYFVNHQNVPAGATSWDASVEQNNSITGWSLDSNNNGAYEVYLGASTGRVSFPADSSYMFSGCSSLNEIDFTNAETSLVTDMSYMFYSLSSLTSIDLSSFDTSKVTNMSGMFYYMTSIQSLDLSNFDTRNVTSMNNMFYYMMGLKELDISNFETPKLTTMNYMFAYSFYLSSIRMDKASFENVTSSQLSFYYLPSGVSIVTRDETTKAWLQSKISNANIVTVAEL